MIYLAHLPMEINKDLNYEVFFFVLLQKFDLNIGFPCELKVITLQQQLQVVIVII